MKKTKMILALFLTLSLLAGCAAADIGNTLDANQLTSAAEITEIQFTDDGIIASAASGLEIDGTALTITAAGTYILSGSCANGSVKVKKDVTGVQLTLNGLNLTSESGAPIVCGKSTEVTIEAAAGMESTLTDTNENNDESGNTEAENAVIKCKDGSKILLCGTGTMNIQANGKNGIKSGASTGEYGEASLTIRELTLNIDAPVNDAVNAEAALNVESGNLTISAKDDALHCDYTLNIGAEGTDGPNITITDCQEGLEGATVNVCSGNINILSTDDCINAANSNLTGYDFALNISGGVVTAYSRSGDGFDSNGDLTISGGVVSVWTANTADNEPLDADGTVTISGGTVLAAGGSSGMGMNLEAAQPCVIFGGSEAIGAPGNDRQFGQSQQPSGDRHPGQGGLPSGQNILLTVGSAFTIANSDGSVLYTADAACNASFLLFSSADLSEDESLTLSSEDNQLEGNAQTGTITFGMVGMGGPGGQRPGGEHPSGSAPSGGFIGQPPAGNMPPEKPRGNPPQNDKNSGNA